MNEDLESNPKLINENPLEAWIMKVEISDPSQLDDLMDQEAYDAFCASEQH